MNKLKSINWKDLGKRALKTFIQAFAAAFAIDGIIAAGDFNALKTALWGATIAAAAAGISAVMNLVNGLISAGANSAEEIEAKDGDK